MCGLNECTHNQTRWIMMVEWMGFYSTGFSHFLDEVSSIFQHLSFFIFNRAKKTCKMCTPIVRSLKWLGIHICAHISYFILVGLMLELMKLIICMKTWRGFHLQEACHIFTVVVNISPIIYVTLKLKMFLPLH